MTLLTVWCPLLSPRYPVCDATDCVAPVPQVPQVSPSQLSRDLGQLLSSADETDAIHDLVLLVSTPGPSRGDVRLAVCLSCD